MTDSDKELKIKVTTAADTSGLRQTLDALKEISDAVKTNSSVTVENTKNQRLLGLGMEDMRGIAKDLGNEWPLVGAAMQLAMNPVVGVAHLAVMGISAIVDKIKEQSAAVEELRREQSQLETDIWNAQRDALNEAADAAFKYSKMLHEIPDAMKAVSLVEKDQLSILNAQLDAQKKILEAREIAEKASATAPNQIAEIDARFGHRKTDAQLSGEQQKIDLLIDQAAARARDNATLLDQSGFDEKAKQSAITDFSAITAKQMESHDVKNQPGLVTAALAALDRTGFGSIPEAEEDLKKRKEHAKAIEKQTGTYSNQMDTANTEVWLAEGRIDEAKKAKAAQDAGQKRIDELNKAVEEHKRALEIATKKAEESAKAFTDNKNEMQRLEHEAHEASQVLAIYTTAAHSVAATQYSQPGAVETIFTPFITAINDAKNGKSTAADKIAVENFKALVETLGWSSKDVISSLNMAANTQEAFRKELQAVKTRLAEVRNTPPGVPPP